MTAERVRQLSAIGVRAVRTWSDVALLGVGGAVLLLSALPIDEASVPGWEQGVFRAINDHTVLPFVVVWLVMQFGNIIAVPIVAGVAAVTRRWRLASGVLLGGFGAYLLAKLVKGLIERGRPDALLDDVHIRGATASGRGYVSGHAAVATLLAVLVWPYLGRRWRIAVVAVAGVVVVARVYVGAHLPLDVIGGAGLGLALGAAIRLLLVRPAATR